MLNRIHLNCSFLSILAFFGLKACDLLINLGIKMTFYYLNVFLNILFSLAWRLMLLCEESSYKNLGMSLQYCFVLFAGYKVFVCC